MKIFARAFFVLATLLSVAAPASEGIAFFSDVKGSVDIDGNRRAALLGELSRGQKVVVGKDGHATVMYIASGKEYALRGPGEYVVKDTEISATSGMPPVTRSTEWRANTKVLVQVSQTSAASMRMRSVPPPPRAEPPARAVFPTQGNISTLQPTFRWAPADPAAEITLSLIGEEKPVLKQKASGASYRVPAKLKPESEYYWVVANASGEIGSGRFSTLPMAAVARLDQRRPSDRASFSDRLNYALLLQEMGAVQEAREAWSRLAQERSDLPELAALAK